MRLKCCEIFSRVYQNKFILQIHPVEIKDDGEVMLICDFEITDLSLTASQCSVKVKMPSSVPPIDSFMPPLDLSQVICNCVNSSLKGIVLLLSCTEARAISKIQRLSLSDNHEENICEEEEEYKKEEEEGEDDHDFADPSGSSRTRYLHRMPANSGIIHRNFHMERQLIS